MMTIMMLLYIYDDFFISHKPVCSLHLVFCMSVQLIWEAEVTSSSHSSKSEPPDFGPAAVGESVKGNVHTNVKSTKGGSSTTSLALRAKATWQQLPFTGYYSDTRFPHCRRQLIAETLTRALLVGADAKTQGACVNHWSQLRYSLQ
jgi:hypothetical protein